MAGVETTGERAVLNADDVASVQVFLRGVTCTYLPKQALGELAVSGTVRWNVTSSLGTRVILRLRDVVHARPQSESGSEAAALTLTLETEAQIELRRSVPQLEQQDQLLLVQLCRPYNLEIIAYLTGRMGITPLMLPVALDLVGGTLLALDGGGVDHGEDKTIPG